MRSSFRSSSSCSKCGLLDGFFPGVPKLQSPSRSPHFEHFPVPNSMCPGWLIRACEPPRRDLMYRTFVYHRFGVSLAIQASFDEKSRPRRHAPPRRRRPALRPPPPGGLELKFASAQVRALEEERGMTIIGLCHSGAAPYGEYFPG